MRVPSARSPRAMNSGPSEASRQAAVAIARTFLTPRILAMALNRLSASSACLTLSSPRWPVEPTCRPRPHSTFSLKIGVGLLTAPS